MESTAASLLDGTALKTLTVFAEGKIMDYVPLMEIPPYATIVIQLER